MKVENNSEIGTLYREFNRYIKDTRDYVDQQRRSFPLNYNEWLIIRNKEIVNKIKK
jgi:hypothetical protein